MKNLRSAVGDGWKMWADKRFKWYSTNRISTWENVRWEKTAWISHVEMNHWNEWQKQLKLLIPILEHLHWFKCVLSSHTTKKNNETEFYSWTRLNSVDSIAFHAHILTCTHTKPLPSTRTHMHTHKYMHRMGNQFSCIEATKWTRKKRHKENVKTPILRQL